MKNSLVSILILIMFQAAQAQQGGFEQYVYARNKEALQVVPLLHYQNSKNWYAEARYNYEDIATASLYGGKIFTKEKNKLSCSALPLAGVVWGKFKGGSLGLNVNLEYKKTFFCSQSQYTFSVEDRSNNFLYSWSEAGYKIWNWLYVGSAIQHTHMYDTRFKIGEKGLIVGLSMGRWVFPLYIFNPSTNNQYFILGINRTLN